MHEIFPIFLPVLSRYFPHIVTNQLNNTRKGTQITCYCLTEIRFLILKVCLRWLLWRQKYAQAMSKEVIKTSSDARVLHWCAALTQEETTRYQFRQKSFLDFASIWSHPNQVLVPVKNNNKNTSKMQKPTNTSVSCCSSACVKPGFSLPRLIKKEQPENVCKTDCCYKVR